MQQSQVNQSAEVMALHDYLIPANARAILSNSSYKRRSKRQQQDTMSLLMNPLRCVWAKPPDLGSRPVPQSLVDMVIYGHRWFKPELVHQTLYDVDGKLEPGLLYMYSGLLQPNQLKVMQADVLKYISRVSEDVFGINPDRYLQIHPDQVIRLDNPSGEPVYIYQKPVEQTFLDRPSISCFFDSTATPMFRLVFNESGQKLWGYSNSDLITYQLRDDAARQPVDDRPKYLPFFMSLFGPSFMSIVTALNFGYFFLKCKHASFKCDIIRRDGSVVPMHCIYTTYLHKRYSHVSHFSFRDVSLSDVPETSDEPQGLCLVNR
uniref:PAS domain-containing protein n=1 Tax=Spongospora subterranea TaxID=70186 RepID=A0A0H5R6Y8_9EUKA|eukprot:CRZ09596.1 hypothetical protein [Spongospora subterranea]